MKKLIAFVLGILFAGNLYAVTLPSGYTELEYIQSDGTNWIETNYRGTEKTGAYLRYQYHSLSKDLSGRVFGYRISGDHQWVTYIGTMSGTTIDTTTYYVQSGALETSPEGLPTLDTEIHEFRINTDGSGEVLFDGALFGNSNGATAFTASQTLRIFSAYNNSQYSNATARIYAVSIYENGVLQKNFVPAKHGNDVGMYETVVGTFYQKSGEHDFVAGPVVCPNGGTPQTYTSATGTVTQNGTPTPANPITPTFYTQGDMVLRKVGNIADSYDATTGKITRRVGVKVLNGTEEFTYNSSTNVINSAIFTDRPLGKDQMVSTHFKYSTANTLNIQYDEFSGASTSNNVFFKKQDITSVESWKQWLAEQYANGTPVTVWYPLTESAYYTEDWAATQCESGNTCNNLFVADNATPGYYIDATGTPKSDNSANYYEYPVTPGQTYTWSGVCGNSSTYNNKRVHGYANGVWQQQITMQTINPGEHYSITFEVPKGINSIRLSFWKSDTMVKLEEGSTATTYCRAPGKIKIATTKYNNTAFSGVVTALSNAVDTIKTVVANTITQATAVANLQSGKQTMPDSTATNGTCPNYKQCLLVEDESGTPHWYVITDPFRDYVTPIIANSVNGWDYIGHAGYTQVEYIESTGTQYIDTGAYITSNNLLVKTKAYSTMANTSTEQDLFGNQDGTDGRMILGLDKFNSFFLYTRYGNGAASPSVKISAGQNQIFNIETHIENGQKWLVVDGVASETGTATNISNTNKTVQLFTNGNTTYFFTGRMYYFQMYDNGTLVRDLVPVRRNSDGKYGMYDLAATNPALAFYPNAATSGADFTAGNPVANPDPALPTTPTWTVVWAPDSDYAGTVNGAAKCNNSASDATSTTSGSNCWCRVTSILVDGTTTNVDGAWAFRTGSGWTDSCVAECATSCAAGVYNNATFRRSVFGF